MSATFTQRVSLALRQIFRQVNFWVIAIVALIASGLMLRERVDFYVQMQSSGFELLDIANDVLSPLWGTIAALMVLCAPILALSARAPWRLLHRRLDPSSSPHANTLATVLALMSILLLCVSTVAVLGNNVHWSWLNFVVAVLGITLLSMAVLLLCLNVVIRLEQTLLAVSACYGLLALLILLEWLSAKIPYAFFEFADIGLFAQYRHLRMGEIHVGALLYFVCLTLALLLTLRGFITKTTQTKIAIALLLMSALASSQWHYRYLPNAPILSSAEQQVLQRYGANLRLTIVSAHPDERRDWEYQLKSLTTMQPTLVISSIHPDQLSTTERHQLPGAQGLLISVGTQSTWLALPSDQLLKRLIQSIAKLGQTADVSIVFLEGHGERTLFGDSPRDLTQLRKKIEDSGLQALSLPLHAGMSIPDNTSVLVIASPEQAYPAAIRQAIMQYMMRGGHLLWLREPDEPSTDASTDSNSDTKNSANHVVNISQAPNPYAGLEAYVGVRKLPGTIVDMASVKRGAPSPAIALIDHYAAHPSFVHLNDVSAFPWAAALEIHTGTDAEITRLLQTNEDAHLVTEQQLETPLEQLPKGPFTVGALLEKKQNNKAQRIAVIGDGHFLADTAIRNYGNSALALSLLQWLAFGEQALAPVGMKAPQTLLLDAHALQWLQWGPLLLASLLLVIGAGYVWRWRRQ